MPYWLESDTFADDDVFEVLAGGSVALADQLALSYVRLKAKSSHLKANGYLTEQTALRYCRGRRRVLDKLTVPALGRQPLLHRQGDECDCLGEEWIDGYAYRIHEFLKRNPSRAEYERNRAQKADLRDARLKTVVYERDGGCCRYCRSGPLSNKAGRSRDRRRVLSYDHVDPDRPAGPDGTGLVVACGACNEYKGHRTPAEAGMLLLPEPTAAERAAWAARGLALFDRPTSMPEQPPITDETPTEHQPTTDHIAESTADATTDPVGDSVAGPGAQTTGEVRPQNGEQPQDQGRDDPGGVSGRVGEPEITGPGRDPPRGRVPTSQPPRTSAAPDIYHRRSRASPPPEEFGWPPGSVPASPRRHQPPDDDEEGQPP